MGREATADEKLRERLTGAAVLVVLVVIFVPAMFRGAPPEPMQPLPSIGLPAAATLAIPDQFTQPATPVITPGLPRELPPAAAALPAVQAAPPAAAMPLPDTPAAVPARSGWVVQLGSFKQRDNAEKLVRSVSAKGIKATVAGPDDRGFFRVRTPIAAERREVEALRDRLRTSGIAGIVSSAP